MNLAPNGNQSNLTPEQYKLVRTPEFKAWFGDWEKLALTKINDSGIDEISLKRLSDGVSKVVDENGEPKVVGRKDFEPIYDYGDEYFTFFAEKKDVRYFSEFGEYETYSFLNIKNPLIIDFGDSWANIPYDVLYKVFSKNDLVKMINYEYHESFKSWEEYIQTLENGYEPYLFSTDSIAGYVKKQKINDGVIIYEVGETSNADVTTNDYVIFKSNQIKLADGTNTTFDGNNPDIRFSLGGEIQRFKEQGILELNFYPTNSEHAKTHNVDAKNPLYLQNLIVNESDRLNNIGKKVLLYLDEYAQKNGHDVIFGYINQKATMTKDNRTGYFTEFTDIDYIKHWLFRNGYIVNRENNNFHKVVDKTNRDLGFKKGGRTIAQTPAPKKERIYGSEKNKPESSKDTKSAEKIEFSEQTLETIKNKVAKHNEKNPKKKVTLASAKAVVRRGMGAYSSSHRPKIKGGKPNSRVAWGLARLNAFFYKIINGKSKSGKYNQDDDLINELGYKVKKYADGGQVENLLNKIKESYDFGSQYFQGEIYGQEFKIRMNKNHPRNSYRNDDQLIHNLSLINVEYPSAVVIREHRGKLQYQYDKIFYWEDAKEKIEDFFYEIKDRADDYSDGGDIQAYEEAMGISEYADGGETKPKKVYVSIRLDNELEKIPNTFSEYFTNYSEKPFQELQNGKLLGLVGVSTSPNNIAEWFISRDCLIVMNYDEFMAINKAETINYYDPYQLMKNDLYLFRRLYANVTRYGEQNDSVNQTIKKICERILPEINLEMNVSQGQKYSELYRISRFLSPYETGAFPRWIEDNKMKIESPIDLTNAILDFNKLYDSYLGSGYENPVLTFDELLPLVEKGITNASKIYESEQEIVLTNRELNIPKKSQLFFIAKDEVGRNRESNRDELIQKYNLKELYKVYFVDRQELQKYRGFWLKKEEEKFKGNIEKGREYLELKKEQVLDELLNYFLEKSITYIKKELQKEILEYTESLEYYDETDDESIEQNLFSIPLVQSIMNTYELIIKNFWKSFIEKKQVKNLDLYAFSNFLNNVHSELKRYFENNKEELEKLNNYRNTRGSGSLDPYRFERLMLKTIYDYENLPELVDYKELAKMYLDKMGREIYRYYDKNELKLVSQYKDGGETDEPTHFWGREAGGVLIYCSTTDRYLIVLRSEWVTEPNTWGIVSGKLDEEDKNIKQAVYREVEEELGGKITNLMPSYIYKKPNFKFHNFISVVSEEFEPKLNWENTDYKWVKLNELPENLHFGLKKLLENEDIPKLVKKNRMENEILVIDMNMYRYDTSVNFKNKEIPLKLNAPINQVKFIEWAEENNFEFEQWGDAGMDDVSWGYMFEVPLNKYIEYLKSENYYTGGELKKGIKTEMEHKDTIEKIKTGDYTIKESAELIAKDHLEEKDNYYTLLAEMERKFKKGGYTDEQNEKIGQVMHEFKAGKLTSYGKVVTDRKQAIAIALSEAGVSKMDDGGKVESIYSEKGDIGLNLGEEWYDKDTDVELVPVETLIKFREFDRKRTPKYNQDDSTENIAHLKYLFKKDGIKSPLIIEYSPDDNAVLLIEGNHRLNAAIDLKMDYLPARVILKKYPFSPAKLKNSMKVSGVMPNEYGYIKSNLKPSEVGIDGAIPITYKEGGIIEGRLHSECGDDGCGRKFQVGEGGHIIEAERDEAVIVANAFNDNQKYTIKGTPSQIASAINVIGGGKNFDKGATIQKEGKNIELPELKQEAVDTDVDDIIDSGSIIINRRSMADKKTYTVTGTLKQIASQINSLNGNGVVITEGGSIKEMQN